MKKSIAFFDFDGTVTRKDTMLELARFSKGNLSYYIGLCILSPWLAGMKVGLINKVKAKEKLLAYFFGGTSLKSFTDLCISFSEKILPFLVREDAMATIEKFKKEKTSVVIVSASAENWVAPWCIKNNLPYISTRLMVSNNEITGKLCGENCNGIEKVIRIKKQFILGDYTDIYCYGDTEGDKMMLKLANHPYYRLFKK
ncbi:MAG: HAD-IB family hydrolase [Ferruginibacter sp.]